MNNLDALDCFNICKLTELVGLGNEAVFWIFTLCKLIYTRKTLDVGFSSWM
jgi:hypothetical protein